MEKLRLSVVETLKYQREMVIEVPDDMSDEALAAVLDAAESCVSSVEEFAENLDGHYGVRVVEKPDTDMDTPYHAEIESDFI